ncbi:MAG: ORF6N domain-containing protein [Acidovorax sp.]
MSNDIIIAGVPSQVISYKGQRVCITQQLAKFYGCDDSHILDNYRKNASRFEEGKHFVYLDGDALKAFKEGLPEIFREPLKFAPKIMLWTERGAARHAKALTTAEAWEVFEDMEDRYFRPTVLPALQGQASDSVAAIILIGDAVAKVPGVKPGIAMAATLTCIQQNTGIETASMRMALPAANEVSLSSLNATNLGKLVNLSAVATNKGLAKLGFQVKNARGDWELTTAGEAWGEALPYAAHTGHSGYQVLWNPAVADKLREAA